MAVPREQADTSKVVQEVETTGGSANSVGNDQGRVADQYQPKGIELGQFLLLPETVVRETYNSNIYATRHDAKADEITGIKPGFHLQSRFDQHALDVDGELEQLFYAHHSSENQLNGQIHANGRYDLASDSELKATAGFTAGHEDRTSPDATFGTTPTPYTQTDLLLGGKTAPGRWVLSSEVSRQQLQYDDVPTSNGTPVDNQGRNRVEYDVTGRVAYELFQGYYAVGQATANRRDYDRQTDIGGVDRSSKGYTVQSGIGLDISQLIRGDFLLGYFRQDYAAPLASPSGLSIKAAFNWTPYKTTLIVPSLERSVLESTVANSSSLDHTALSLLARHELRRNIVLSAFGSVARDQYTGLGVSSWTYETRGSVTYALSRNLYVGGELGYKQRNAPVVTGNAFGEEVVTFRLGVRM